VVLKHIYSLIKYNQNEQLFTVSPSQIRYYYIFPIFFALAIIYFNLIFYLKTKSKLTPVNAFLSGLPMVLDRNFALGNNILIPVLRLLRYLPLPSIDENVSIRACQLQSDSTLPNYTIGLLSAQARYSWILSFIIILYKVIICSFIHSRNVSLQLLGLLKALKSF
jgi:hypothetical protein